MGPILIVYATTEGQTGKIAQFLGRTIRSVGIRADVVNAATGADPAPEDYAATIVAASVHAGGYQRPVRRWVKKHAAALNVLPTAFVSVCLGVLEHKPAVDRELARILRAFFDKTGWHPGTYEIVAGALPYTRYNFFKRWITRRIVSKVPGGDVDTSRDFEYTNWGMLRAFVVRFCRLPVAAAA